MNEFYKYFSDPPKIFFGTIINQKYFKMKISNYNELLNKANNVNLQQVIERNIDVIGKGYTKVEIEDVLITQIAQDIATLLGGRNATKETVIKYITSPENTFLYHINFSDIVLEKKEGKQDWKLLCKQNYKKVKQDIRDYFNRL